MHAVQANKINVGIRGNVSIITIQFLSLSHQTWQKTLCEGYAYKGLLKPVINEQLTTEMEPNNVADKYAVCVKKNNIILSQLPFGKKIREDNILFPPCRQLYKMF